MSEEEMIIKWCQENTGFCDIQEIRLKLNEWLKPATNTEKAILLSLFEHSHYFNKKFIFTYFEELYSNLYDKDYTLFSTIESQGYRHNSSHEYLNELRVTLELQDDYSIIHSLKCFPINDMIYIKNIVFIDDIIGTGNTTIKFFDKVLNYLSERTIYLWVVCITEDAYDIIRDYANEKKLDIKVQAKRIEKKAFKKGYIFDDEDSDEKEKIIFKYEQKMWGKSSKCLLGYDNSQCLVSFYNDTPNNTLSSFWYNQDPYKAIFHRREKKKPRWFTEREKERRKENYERRVNSYV